MQNKDSGSVRGCEKDKCEEQYSLKCLLTYMEKREVVGRHKALEDELSGLSRTV